MKKLHLDLVELHVESFEPAPDAGERSGTINAREFTLQTCNLQYTCARTCDLNQLSCNNQNTCYGPGCPASLYPTCYPCHTGDIC